jgi:hypothetical protein
MLQEVCAEKCRSIPVCRVFAHPMGLEEEPRAQVVLGVMGLGAEKIDEGRKTFPGERGERREIKPAPSKRLETAQGTDDGRCAGGELLNGGLGLDVLRRYSNCRCLFILGIFPEYASWQYHYLFSGQVRPQIRGRMRIGPEDYEKEGRKFYGLAAEHPSARELGLSEVFGALHDHFQKVQKPLSFIADHYLRFKKERFFV